MAKTNERSLIPQVGHKKEALNGEDYNSEGLVDQIAALESQWNSFQSLSATKNREFAERCRSMCENHLTEMAQLAHAADNNFQEGMEDVHTLMNTGDHTHDGNMFAVSGANATKKKKRATMAAIAARTEAASTQANESRQAQRTSPGPPSPKTLATTSEETSQTSAPKDPPLSTEDKIKRNAQSRKSSTEQLKTAFESPPISENAGSPVPSPKARTAGDYMAGKTDSMEFRSRASSIGTLRRQRITKFQDLGIKEALKVHHQDKIVPGENGDSPTYIILPNGDFRVRWDLFMVSLILYYAVAVPIRVGFDIEPPTNAFSFLEIIFNLCFIADMVLNFVTAQRVKGVLVTDHKRIALIYLQSWFWIDLVASFPFDIINTSHEEGSDALKVNKLFRILRIFKLLRLLRLGRVMARLREYTKVNPSLLLLAKTSLMMFILWHWSACLYWFIASSEEASGFTHLNTWTPLPLCGGDEHLTGLETGNEACLHDSFQDHYSHAFFWAVVSTTGVGWDIIPTTPLEVAFTSIMIVIGVMMSVTIIGSVTSTLQNLNSAQQMKRQKMERIFSYLRSRMVPATTQAKIRGYFQYLWSYDVEIDEPFPLDALPDSLQIEVAVEVNRHLIEKVPIFHGMSPEATFDIISSLVRKVYLPGDDIISEGDTSREMYLLVRGSVKVLVDEMEVADLEEGAFFGENALLTDTPRNATVMAVDYCDVLMLPRKSFQACLAQHPPLRKSIEDTAAMRTKAVSRWKKAINAASWAVDQHPEQESQIAAVSTQASFRAKQEGKSKNSKNAVKPKSPKSSGDPNVNIKAPRGPPS